MIAFTRKFERENGWSVVGDANSRRVAESFELPARLHKWEGGVDAIGASATANGSVTDALQSLAEEDADNPSGLSRLLGSKTQGLPYHALIVAVATLIENRQPGVALACGNFDVEDADRACDGLARIFGEPFGRPVLLEPARIRMRVPDLDADSLSKRHTDRIAPETAAVLRCLIKQMRTDLREDLDFRALVCTDVNQLCDETRMAFTLLGIRLAQLTAQMKPMPAGEDRARIMLRAIADGTTEQYIRLTDMAWDCIESADDETRKFLRLLCQLKCEHLQMHQTVRAIYENPIVRDHVMACWRSELDNPRGIPPEIAELVSS